MTLPAYAVELGGRLPSDSEKAAANQLRKILAAHGSSDAKLRVMDGRSTHEIVLSPALSALLIEVLRNVGRGDAVTLVPVGQMLTTQQAADILNVSRPHLISLLEKDELVFTLVGRHRRIRAEHLFSYKEKRDARRSKALDDLAAVDAELI